MNFTKNNFKGSIGVFYFDNYYTFVQYIPQKIFAPFFNMAYIVIIIWVYLHSSN